ncbi:hypothetical protein J2W37_002422 [Variovorax paradoxus]|uniref:Uncharacterized protein n=1 Tax=Variovorax paradoxus TaxID=34073 RepID=A0AAE3Y0U5_VARPD|nr:hypothetical protein [Variovorax paradoxus]MDP9964702.1 hypothetical protein [Variovorax paradoxus]MDR6427602.1 hypothetical protein [Variovorax paradoxus]MDR6454763.1 hypothetical protein [Variovorax paradoxus]
MTSLLLFGCGGGGGGGGGGAGVALVGSPTGQSGSGASSNAGPSSGGQGTGGASGGGDVQGGGGIQGGGDTAPVAATVALASRLGKPARVLVGLGATSIDDMKSQDIQPDIVERYLVGVGPGSWPTWNSPDGAYVTFTAQAAQAYGAVPMFTLYQMTANGEGNLSGISDKTFMDKYWGQVRLMYQRIAELGTPVLINLEPDFWGFAASQAPGRDLTKMAAAVSGQPECSTLPNTVAGLGQCFVQMGRKVAPKALLGFPPAFWNGTPAEIAAQMRTAGANQADFIVAQTSDRDAGCREAASRPAECQNGSAPFYWDASNKTSPNFHDSQKQYSDYRAALGNGLPILWWQTPMGVPSDTPGGTDQHYRDNHVDYMLRNTQEYGDMQTFAIIFSAGGSHQTSIATDGGQFARLSAQYLARGGAALK